MIDVPEENGTNGTEKIFKDIIEENVPKIKKDLNTVLKKKRYKTNTEINELQEKGMCGHPERKKVPFKGLALYFTVLTFTARK